MSEPVPRPRGRLAPALIGGLVGAAAVLLAAAALVTARPALLHRLLADRDDRLAALESANAGLAAQLAALRGAAVPPDDVEQRLARLSGDLEQLRRAMPPQDSVLLLTERVDAAEQAMREALRSQSASQAALLAVGQLREAVNGGGPFADELLAVRHLLAAEQAAALAPLDEAAAAGIARRDQLAARLPALSRQLLDQENQIRGRGLWHVIGRHLQQVFTLRRMDGHGNDAEAVMARVEAAVAANDWERAIGEIAGLPAPFAAAAAPWRRQAELRLAADRLLSRLTAQAAAQSVNR